MNRNYPIIYLYMEQFRASEKSKKLNTKILLFKLLPLHVLLYVRYNKNYCIFVLGLSYFLCLYFMKR
jgi:hypothetical protein